MRRLPVWRATLPLVRVSFHNTTRHREFGPLSATIYLDAENVKPWSSFSIFMMMLLRRWGLSRAVYEGFDLL